MEKLGVPAVVVATEPFISSGKAMAVSHGMPDYPFVVIPHPISSASGDELGDRARTAAEAIAAMMLPMLYDRLGITNAKLRYLTAHRWRYAKVSEPLGRPFIRHKSGTLYAGGDWCLGARLEAAWTSGDSIARDILGLA